MCATCVAQGAPYFLGTALALRAMSSSAVRRRQGRDHPAAVEGKEQPDADVPASA